MEMPILAPLDDDVAVKQRLERAELAEVIEVFDRLAGKVPAHESLLAVAKTLQLERASPRMIARVIAQALSRPAAVWWACRVARSEHGGGVAEAEQPALEAAEAWLRSPEQWRAYAANEAAKSIGLATPAGCAALAAFLAGESIAPSHLPALVPEPQLAGMASAAAVELAATRRVGVEGFDPWQHPLEIGFAIASGADSWQPINATVATR